MHKLMAEFDDAMEDTWEPFLEDDPSETAGSCFGQAAGNCS